jgi:hypothetical protein
VQGVIFTRIKKKTMNENPNEYEYCLKLALDNAKKRMIVLDGPEKKCVLDEYKEWINDGLSMHTVLLLREDPII